MESIVTSAPREVLGQRDRVPELLKAFISRRSATTQKAYEADLKDFARYTEAESVQAAVWALISEGPGGANSVTLHYKNNMTAAGKAPATVNRRLSALRSVVTMARTLGIVTWSLEVGNERAQAYRDTRGPGRSGVRALLYAVKGSGSKAVRDRAIIRLMYDLALRRGEITSLRLEDADFTAKRVWIRGKGRNGAREPLTLPEKTAQALADWISCRGDKPGPMFTNFDRARKGTALTGAAIWYLVRQLAWITGLETRPHGIRHAAITEALDRTKDPRAVQRFSRHRDLGTVLRYDDNREDMGGRVAEAVAAGL